MGLPEFKPARGEKQQPTIVTEAVQALVNLGYKPAQAKQVIQDTIAANGFQKRIDEDELTAENLFMAAMSPANATQSQPPSPVAEPPAIESQSIPDETVAAVESHSEPQVNPPTSSGLAMVQQSELPPVAPDQTRFYHGGAEYQGGKRFVSPDRSYAEGYTDENRKLHYVDIENSSPYLKKSYDDSGTDAPAPFINFEAPEEIAKNLRPVERPVESRPPVPPPAQQAMPADVGSARSMDTTSQPASPTSSTVVVQKQSQSTRPPSQQSEAVQSDPAVQRDVVQVQDRAVSNTRAREESLPSGSRRSSRSEAKPTPQPMPAPPASNPPNNLPPGWTGSQNADTRVGAPPVVTSTAKDTSQASESSSVVDGGLDAVQTGLDVAGVADPTPIADGANAIISLGRAATDPKNAGTHLLNAGISMVSMIPYVGDIAKGLKYGAKGAKAGVKGSQAAGKATAKGEAAATGGASPIATARDVMQQSGGIGGGGPIATGGGGSGGDSDGGSGDGSSPGSPEPSGITGDNAVKTMTDQALNLAGTFGTIVAVGLTYAKTTELLNRSVLEYHKNISSYNAQTSQAYGELETGRQQRQMQNASDYGGSVANLAGSQNELEEALRDFQSPFTEIAVDIQVVLTEIATAIIQVIDYIEPLSELYPVIKAWLGIKTDDRNNMMPTGFFDFLKKQADKRGGPPKGNL